VRETSSLWFVPRLTYLGPPFAQVRALIGSTVRKHR
jgi:hypothetical protein